jgi:hypothetical protein
VNIRWRLATACWLLTALPAAAQSPPRSNVSQTNVGRTADLEDFERRLGPFELSGQSFTVMLRGKRVAHARPLDPDSQETVVGLQIRDAGGTVHYGQTFPYEVAGNEFAETLEVSAQKLEGSQGAGLLLTYGVLPSPPLGGESWQVLGLFDRKLVPFSKRIFADGGLTDVPGDGVARTSREPQFLPDVLRLRVWAGNFFVIVPLRVDWLLAKMSPAWVCAKLTGSGSKPLCEYRVEAERTPSGPELTFVRLFAEADEGMGTPAHVVVKPDSKIEILSTEAEAIWQEDADGVGVSVGDDPWLKVRIDGKEGWIHTQEDFQAIGLPQTG